LTDAVLDASVVIKWFRSESEPFAAEARQLRAAFGNGHLLVAAPSLVHLEILNVAARRWHLDPRMLDALVAALLRLGFSLHEPDLRAVAAWAARGLTAYDASYVALAESLQIPLVTADQRILDVAEDIAIAMPQFVNETFDRR
jgi:predicted nucleic acid-binding protein